MKQRTMLAVLMAFATVGTAHGQSSSQDQFASAGAAEPVPEAAVEAGSTEAGYGWSGAVRVFVTGTTEPLEHATLSALGEGWERGHRWTLLHGPMEEPSSGGDPEPRVLGEPAGVPVTGPGAATAAADRLSTGTRPAPEAQGDSSATSGARVLGDPAPGAASGSSDIAMQAFASDSIVTPDQPGVWMLESGTGSATTVITQVPATQKRDGVLNGYRIGTYPTERSGRTDRYAPPTAFIEVTPSTRDLPVSDHLTLGQFLTKDQFDVWPKYVALDLRLIDKLELMMDELAAMGIRADHLHVMSGFRTPHYNGPGGDGRAALSRHMWGDAADVWVDNDRDGMMDDLNGDGRIDLNDAGVMMRAIERVERRFPELIGGAGSYPNAPTHGPYIHVDARGQRSRW